MSWTRLTPVVITALLTLSCGSGRASSTTPAATRAPPASALASTTTVPAVGQAASSILRLVFVDQSRKTVSRGHVISQTRTLPTTVWLPATPRPSPLVVFAHGFRLGVEPYRRACQTWADAGFVVVAPSFPLTDEAVAGQALDESDIANQPADVRFVMTAALSSNSDPQSALKGRIDPHKIAVVGHSDGAETALAVGYLPTERDSRIGAVVADAANPLPGISPSSPLMSTIPLLLIHGDADEIVPFAASLKVQRQIHTTGWLLRLNGGDHLHPIQGPSAWTTTFDSVTRDFLNEAFAGSDSRSLLPTDALASGGTATITRL